MPWRSFANLTKSDLENTTGGDGSGQSIVDQAKQSPDLVSLKDRLLGAAIIDRSMPDTLTR